MSSSRSTLALGAFAALWVAGCGTPSVTPDASTADVASDNPDAGHGCVTLARCVRDCGDQACVDVCEGRASATDLSLFRAQVACVFGSPLAMPPVPGACPNASGGVCDRSRAGFTEAACDACVRAAQDPGGACDAQVTACQLSP